MDMKYYYVDGYHGGIRGHMPLGCWKDILQQLADHPEWKLSIDVEPISWIYLQTRDPAAYTQLREMLRDQSISSRLEIVAGTYGQPYSWTIDGECNIRQLLMGLETISSHFPWVKVDTYAVQEPCWTSSLPQILRSFGFNRAVLKDPSTAWGGYSSGFDREICDWVGPDGTGIPAVPRYSCEELLKAWETESVTGKREFLEKCIDHGIFRPAGMFFQDLGWPSKPQLSNMRGYEGEILPEYATYTTWKEYFDKYSCKPEAQWKISQEDFQVALPWGERLLVRMARQIRRGETAVSRSERLLALAALTGRKQDDLSRIRTAWQHLLISQHHDGWICASTGRHEDNWAWKTSAQIYAIDSITENIDRDAMTDISMFLCPQVHVGLDSEILCVANTLGRAEYRTVCADVTSARGIKSFLVYDGEVLLESQYIPERQYSDGSKNAGKLLFRSYFPGFGAKTFRIEPVHLDDICGGACATVDTDKAFLENRFYRIAFDLNAGGTISSLFDKQQKQELVDQSSKWRFNEYCGYFIHEAAFLSSADHRASATVCASGPILAELMIEGVVGNTRFTQRVSLTEDDRKIRVDVTFHFPEKTYIGEPHQIVPEDNKEDRYRSYHDGRYKLNAYFPTAFAQKYLHKDAAYDVCRSRQENTHFKKWDEIKHNILVGWVDVSDDSQGLTVMADHTTSYVHGDGFPLGLTMAWGWDGGYWWGKRQLKGDQHLSYIIVPHAGDWRHGNIWHEYQKMLHLPVVRRIAGKVPTYRHTVFITVRSPVELSAAYLDTDGRLILRLFNPGTSTCTKTEIDSGIVQKAELVELDGTSICEIETMQQGSRTSIETDMPEFGIRTLRITISYE